MGALFTAQIALNPFYYSWKPHEHMKHGPLRLLPVELTLVNDLPINTDVERVRVLFGTTPRFQIYFLDDNTYTKEGEFFWVRGKSRADLLFKTPDPVTRLKLTLATGAVAADVVITAAGQRITRQLPSGRGRCRGDPDRPRLPLPRHARMAGDHRRQQRLRADVHERQPGPPLPRGAGDAGVDSVVGWLRAPGSRLPALLADACPPELKLRLHIATTSTVDR